MPAIDPVPTSASVLCLGEVLIDLIVSDDSPSLEMASAFTARPGGAPANVAVALARLGMSSAFCGAVGDDPFGIRLRKVLQSEHVDTTHLAVITGESTTLAFAWKDVRGDGHFRIIRLADARLSDEHVTAADIAARSAIIVGSVALTERSTRAAIYRAVQLAASAGIPVVFDVNIRPSLWSSMTEARAACQPVFDKTTILKLSVDDAGALLGVRDPIAIYAREIGSDTVRLVTDGGRGAWFRNQQGAVEHVPAFRIEPVEPTGAGDAFTAAIVYRYLTAGRPLERDDVVFAAAAGAITATRVGAIESLPTGGEIERFLADRSSHRVRI